MDVFTPCIEYVETLVTSSLAEASPKPSIAIGGFSVEKPFQVYVCEDPQDVSFTDRSTSHVTMGGSVAGLYRVEFSVMVQMQAVRKEIWEASKLVLSWFEAFSRAVANDKALGGLCTHAAPYFSIGETTKRDRQYAHVIEGGVRITADFNPKS